LEIIQAINNINLGEDAWNKCLLSIRNILNESLVNKPNLGPHNPGKIQDWYQASLSYISTLILKIANIEYVRYRVGNWGALQEISRSKQTLQSAENMLKWILD